MMHWEESEAPGKGAIPESVMDAVFSISCRSLPVDHAYALSQAVQRALPWFADDESAGMHIIHIAGSGNGWISPSDPQALLPLSRRAKLVLRVPATRTTDARGLLGQTLDVGGNALRVEQIAWRPLARITTLFSRNVVIDAGADESGFLRTAVDQLRAMGVRPKKMMCGLTTQITTPARMLRTCSLMLADISLEESMLLQRRGLGPERKLGCGLFLPHKDINDVRRRPE